MKEDRISKILHILTAVLVVISIAITYYVMVVEKDYVIFTNPDGPDTSDYFE